MEKEHEAAVKAAKQQAKVEAQVRNREGGTKGNKRREPCACPCSPSRAVDGREGVQSVCNHHAQHKCQVRPSWTSESLLHRYIPG